MWNNQNGRNQKSLRTRPGDGMKRHNFVTSNMCIFHGLPATFSRLSAFRPLVSSQNIYSQTKWISPQSGAEAGERGKLRKLR